MAIALLVTKYFLIGSLIVAGIIGFFNLLCVIADKLHICKDSFVAFILFSIILGFTVFVIEKASSEHKQPPQNPTQIERSYNQK